MAPKSIRLRTRRAGVTLLELLLALALSVIVLTAIGMAINLHFKMVDVRRTSLEEMQVVRVVTLRMTNDIRMLVQPNKPDLSGLETAFANAMQAATKQATAAAEGAGILIGGSGDSGGQNQGGGGGQGAGGQAQGSGGGQGGGGQQQEGGGGQQGGGQGGQQSSGGGANASKTGGGQSGQTGGSSQSGTSSGGGQSSRGASGQTGSGAQSGSSGAQASSSQSTTASATPAAPAVQLIGTATELRFDISRLPRVDQYAGIMAAGGELSATDLPSDVKTIAYYIRSQQAADSVAFDPNVIGGEASTDGYGRGLMRAEMDRAVTTWAETAGATDSIYANAQLLAEEVVGLGFEYYDGVEWLTEWDSSSSGTLPRAIRIWLSVKPTYGMSEQEIADAAAAGKNTPEQDFYFVISVPTAPLVPAPPATESTDAASATSATSSTSQTSGTTTQGAAP